jgi:hypothetical protein
VSRRNVAFLIAGVVVAVAVAVASAVLLTSGSGAAKVPPNDALFNLDGVAAAATGGSSVTVSLGKERAQRFQGTTGCASRHFVAHYGGDPNSPMLFTYTPSQATLAYSSDVYRFDEGPSRQGALLLWQGDFGPAGTFGHIIVQVHCPPP